MKKWVGLFYLSFVLLFFYSCCSSKKFTSTTRTETITKIDTMLIVKTDTIPKIVKVFIHDTARIETERVKTISYYDTTLHKIVLKLQEKSFLVPLTIYKKEITNQKIKTVEKDSSKLELYIILFLIMLLIGGYLFKKITK